jgi:hypothetical protein
MITKSMVVNALCVTCATGMTCPSVYEVSGRTGRKKAAFTASQWGNLHYCTNAINRIADFLPTRNENNRWPEI